MANNLTNPQRVITVGKLNYFWSKMADMQKYNDVYIGVGDTYTEVMVPANHHDSVTKGSSFSFIVSSTCIWVILPNTYSPVVIMGGIQIPMTAQSPVTVDGVTYKVYRSDNEYEGTFNISMI